MDYGLYKYQSVDEQASGCKIVFNCFTKQISAFFLLDF